MDINEVIQVIGSLGFPIAVCLWFMIVDHKDSKANTEAIISMSKAVENNTKAIEKLH